MQAAGKSEKKELTSWKEIAEYLEVSVRTAQRYEEELGLPVRRLGGDRGRAVAVDVEDLERWRRAHVTPQKWWQSPRFLRGYSLAATALVLLFGGYTIRDLAGKLTVGKPVTAEWIAGTLVAYDSELREVWRKTFRSPPGAGARSMVIQDLDGDGSRETILHYVPSHERDSLGAPVICISEKGEELWRLQPKRVVSDRGKTFSNVYLARSFKIFNSPEKDGTKWVVAVFVHHYDYPSVAVVVDAKGKQRGEYWSSGHIDDVYSSDLDGDGIEELLMAGANLGLNEAVVRVFDPAKVAGAEVMPDGHSKQLQGFAPGTEKAMLRFARTRLNRLRDHFNFAYRIGQAPASSEDGSFFVDVCENLTHAQGYLTYRIGKDLKLISVFASDSLRHTYREFALKNPEVGEFSESDLEAARRGYRVDWRGEPGRQSPDRGANR